jgi:uncharacterized damage-inducible protein DinB
MKSEKSRDELAALQDFFSYNTFVRKKYLEALAKLSTADLTKNRGASFPSLQDIFVHVLDVYHCWLYAYETGRSCNRWEHTSKTGELIPPELKNLSFAQVRKMERVVESQIQKVIRTLTAEDLEKSFEFQLREGNKKTVKSRNVGEMLWHLVEEELQHRGELNALLWQDDVEPPVTGWFAWKRESKM